MLEPVQAASQPRLLPEDGRRQNPCSLQVCLLAGRPGVTQGPFGVLRSWIELITNSQGATGVQLEPPRPTGLPASYGALTAVRALLRGLMVVEGSGSPDPPKSRPLPA